MTTTSSFPSWSPSQNDHLIFKWIKLEGKSQSFVASAFGISQPTVSRIIQRYERWQAHAGEREGGRLDHSERLRAQRWLTFERNELFLASCIRIAKDMEGFTEVSKETVSRSTLHPNDPGNFRTETANIDRSGVAARFLRLAFRINMEQLKLATLNPAPPALPLSAQELADLDRDALATAQEFEHAQHRADDQAQSFAAAGFPAPAPFPTPDNADSLPTDPFAWPLPPPPTAPDTSTQRASEGERSSTSTEPTPHADLTTCSAPCLPVSPPKAGNVERETLSPGQPANLIVSITPTQSPSVAPARPIHPVNNLNNDPAPQIAATSNEPTNYEFPPAAEKISSLNNDHPSHIPLDLLILPTVSDAQKLTQLVANSPDSSPHQSTVSAGASP